MGLRVKFLGAVGTVTGSCHMLHDTRTDRYYLIDCGLFQGIGASKLNESRFIDGCIGGIPCNRISAVFLTHAHLDHCGMLPNLVQNGFEGPIYSTEFTKWATLTTLYDSAKHGYGSYGEGDVMHVQRLMRSVDEDEKYNPFVLGHSRKIHRNEDHLGYDFTRTSHLLGCVAVGFIFNDKPEGSSSKEDERIRIQFGADTGSVWNAKEQGSLVKSIQYPAEYIQTLVLESTYGDKRRESLSYTARLEALADALEDACKGKQSPIVVIPAFALQRTHEIILDIAGVLYFHKSRVPSLYSAEGRPPEIISTSRMANGLGHLIAREFRRLNGRGKEAFANKDHPLLSECGGEEEKLALIDHLFAGISSPDFADTFPIIHSKEVHPIKKEGRCRIILGSNGMCAGGGITDILAETLPNPECTVFLTGYQSPSTPGHTLAKLAEGKTEANPENFESRIRIPLSSVNARVVNLGRLYSGHGDKDTIVRYCLEKDRSEKNYSRITAILVHGDDAARNSLREALQKWDKDNPEKSRGLNNVFIPSTASGWYDCKAQKFMPDSTLQDSERLAITQAKLANIQSATERFQAGEISTEELLRIVSESR